MIIKIKIREYESNGETRPLDRSSSGQ